MKHGSGAAEQETDLEVKVIALARALADTGEHGEATVGLGDVVDEFHDEHGLADTGTAEQANLATLGVRGEHVNDLDASDEHLGFDLHVDERRGVGVDGGDLVAGDGATLVDRLADDVHDAAEGAVADRDLDRVAGVNDLLATDEAFGTVHGDGADCVLAKVLRDFEDEADGVVLDLEGVEDRRQGVVELDVDDGTDDGNDLAIAKGGRGGQGTRHCNSEARNGGAVGQLQQRRGRTFPPALQGAASASPQMPATGATGVQEPPPRAGHGRLRTEHTQLVRCVPAGNHFCHRAHIARHAIGRARAGSGTAWTYPGCARRSRQLWRERT